MAKRRKRVIAKVLGIVTLLLVVGGIVWVGPLIKPLLGILGDKVEKRDYAGTSRENMKRLRTALMLYHDSEGQFPAAEGWMDAIENRLNTEDLNKGEAKKKLHNPALPEGQYGYAMNDEFSGKYQEEVADGAKKPLIYESKQTGKNAHGNPATDRNGEAITASGEIIE